MIFNLIFEINCFRVRLENTYTLYGNLAHDKFHGILMNVVYYKELADN